MIFNKLFVTNDLSTVTDQVSDHLNDNHGGGAGTVLVTTSEDGCEGSGPGPGAGSHWNI